MHEINSSAEFNLHFRAQCLLMALFGRDRRVGECLLLREERKSGLRGPISVFDPEADIHVLTGSSRADDQDDRGGSGNKSEAVSCPAPTSPSFNLFGCSSPAASSAGYATEQMCAWIRLRSRKTSRWRELVSMLSGRRSLSRAKFLSAHPTSATRS